MKNAKRTVAVAALTAALAVSSTPALARECSIPGGGIYICEYGITTRPLPGGRNYAEQFVIGADKAVWTRAGDPVSSGDWVSLLGAATSEVFIESENIDGKFHTRIIVLGTDNKPWSRERPSPGEPWTPWVPARRPS
ncbi:hypothetical protein [Streptomyces subrutilus]|uniref:hypothetical protein n=1 Tax=Streptomyces subrutilus TaxID=36818 RepID=UPI003403CD90